MCLCLLAFASSLFTAVTAACHSFLLCSCSCVFCDPPITCSHGPALERVKGPLTSGVAPMMSGTVFCQISIEGEDHMAFASALSHCRISHSLLSSPLAFVYSLVNFRLSNSSSSCGHASRLVVCPARGATQNSLVPEGTALIQTTDQKVHRPAVLSDSFA